MDFRCFSLLVPSTLFTRDFAEVERVTEGHLECRMDAGRAGVMDEMDAMWYYMIPTLACG